MNIYVSKYVHGYICSLNIYLTYNIILSQCTCNHVVVVKYFMILIKYELIKVIMNIGLISQLIRLNMYTISCCVCVVYDCSQIWLYMIITMEMIAYIGVHGYGASELIKYSGRIKFDNNCSSSKIACVTFLNQ